MDMTPDQCFDEMAVSLGLPKETGYLDILAEVKKLKEENQDLTFDSENLQVENEVLKDNLEYAKEGHLEITVEELKKENKKLQKYAQIMGDIDGDELTDLLNDYGWEYNEDGELEKREESK